MSLLGEDTRARSFLRAECVGPEFFGTERDNGSGGHLVGRNSKSEIECDSCELVSRHDCQGLVDEFAEGA